METSPNSREGIEEIVTKMLAICWDSKMKKHDGTSIVVSFTKAELCELLLNLQEQHHQELQKAREEERERIIYVTKNIKDAFMSPLTERRWLQCIQFTDQPKPKDQSELDQPITSNKTNGL